MAAPGRPDIEAARRRGVLAKAPRRAVRRAEPARSPSPLRRPTRLIQEAAMPDPILQKFRDVGDTRLHVSEMRQEGPLPTGSLGGRLFRSQGEKDTNIGITRD